MLFFNRIAGVLRSAGMLAALCVAESAAVELPPDFLKHHAASAAEKSDRTQAQQKIEARLILRIRQLHGDGKALALPAPAESERNPRRTLESSVTVDIRGDVGPALLAAISTHGGIVRSVSEAQDVATATIPLGALESVAAYDEVHYIRLHSESSVNQTAVDASNVARSALIAHAVDVARQRTGLTGRGVKLGVISDSVDHLAESQALGALPAVEVLSDSDGFGEGTAMLEIVHAIAPGAELYFAAGLNQLDDAIRLMVEEGVDIVVDDITTKEASPFQPDSYALAAKAAADAGVLYFSSAGNVGNLASGSATVYEADYRPASISTTGNILDIHTFPEDNAIITAFTGGDVCLFWNDPLGASINDYDLYVYPPDLSAPVAIGNSSQTGTQDPMECVDSVEAGQYIIIARVAGEPRYLHLAMTGNTARPAFNYTTDGAIRGHQGMPEVFAVAAVDAEGRTTPFNASDEVAALSGDGNRRWYYDADGQPITPDNLTGTGGRLVLKPDISAAMGMNTTVSELFQPFYGTSAAAPVAAAIAALMLEANPDLTVESMREIFAATAIDIGPQGPDVTSGYGIITATGVLEFMFRSRTVPMVGGGFAAVLLLGIVRLAIRARARA